MLLHNVATQLDAATTAQNVVIDALCMAALIIFKTRLSVGIS